MGSPLCIGLVAGELSGDQLGAALIRRIRESRPDVRFAGIAGPQMRAAGCLALAQAEDLSVMGLTEVLVHLPRLLRLRRRVLRYFLEQPPQLFIGIDAPDFNLGLERRLKALGIPTLHWVSPAVWAWRRYRVNKIRRSVDCMLTLFPFETGFYRRHGVTARYVGHPLADEIPQDCGRASAREALDIDTDIPCVALLPGSRRSEIGRLLPRFLEAAAECRRGMPALRFVLPVASADLMDLCRDILQRGRWQHLDITVLEGEARTAMCAADAVLLASGTAALECLLLKRPMVVAYRLHPLSYLLVRRLLRVPYVCLPNNLLNRAQVPELLQSEATPSRLAGALLELLQNPGEASRQVAPFAALHDELRCDSARQVAAAVLERLSAE
ncbi:MAG: lipid-A-disaccharide synthase [Thiogranum sp.]|jgi:lipid-A-disaccharide synthase|nr:lipid-A-disaccharide synthase [Thiogranum sp.]